MTSLIGLSELGLCTQKLMNVLFNKLASESLKKKIGLLEKEANIFAFIYEMMFLFLWISKV